MSVKATGPCSWGWDIDFSRNRAWPGEWGTIQSFSWQRNIMYSDSQHKMVKSNSWSLNTEERAG